MNNGQWHHVAATRDAVSGQMLIYLDGALQASGYGPVGVKNSPPALRIGSIQAGYAGGFLNGAIDDVQIFDRVFAASEIPQLMNHPPTIASALASYSILAGRTLAFTNTATDPDLPAQTLTWSLLAPPAGAAINPSSGVFNWRPSVAQSPATNTLTIQVMDNGSPVLSATQSFNVTVRAPVPPVLSNLVYSATGLAFDVNGDQGPDYVVLDSTNLRSWSQFLMTNPSAMPFRLALTNPPNRSQNFYRLQLQ